MHIRHAVCAACAWLRCAAAPLCCTDSSDYAFLHTTRIPQFLIVLLCGAVFLMSPSTTDAQTESTLPDRDVFEALLDPASEDDASALIEEIEELARDPLCLRKASAEEIAALPFLSPAEASAIAAALQQPVARQTAEAGWHAVSTALKDDADRLGLLRYCCRMNCATTPPRFGGELRSRIQQDDRARVGYHDGSYPGSRSRVYQRLRLRLPAGITAGITMEKDPGETSLSDHLTGAVSMDGEAILRRAVFGDFTLTAGQGLVFWQAFARSKSSEAARIGKSAALLRPFTSASEGLAFRGAAAELRLGAFDILGFYSSRALDATVDDENGTVGSLGQTGLHRTASEQLRRGTVREQSVGGVAQWRSSPLGGSLLLGATAVSSRFSRISLSRSPFAFEGDAAWAMGMHARFSTDDAAVYAEAALAHTQVPAVVAGAEIALSPHLRIAFLYRRYHERFVSLYAAAFSERSGGPRNEEGMYTGLRLKPHRKLRIDAWCDVFRIPNRTYFLHLPTSGGELLLGAEYRMPAKTRLYLRLRRERKDQTVTAINDAGRDIRPLTARTTTSVRLQLQREFDEGLRVRLRTEYTRVAFDVYGESGDGALLSAELRMRPLPMLTFTGRVTGYSTASYDARLYQFEHDVRGVMLNAVCYGEGVRLYLLGVLQVGAAAEISARYALTLREGVQSFGSGRDAVTGDRLGTLSLQLDLRM